MDIDRDKLQSVASNAGVSGTLALAGLGVEALAHNPMFLVAGGLVAYASWKYKAGDKLVEIRNQLKEGGSAASNSPVLPSVKHTPALSVEERIIAQERIRLQNLATHRLPETTEKLPAVIDDFEPEPELELRSPKASKKIFTLSQVLSGGFTPTLDQIYLGRLMDGTPVYSTAVDLCHVAIAGLTGGGKSSIIRSLAAQLCYAGANVLILNPHHTRYDLQSNPKEDWTPFEPYLVADPMECRKFENIEFYLKQVAEELLPQRLEKRAHSRRLGKPYFIVLDEIPAIVAKVPNAPEYLGYILREGRKVGINLIVASQDFLVKTIGVDGGAVRKCFLTAFYTGGDATTASVLLNTSEKNGNMPPEDKLGKGTIMARCSSVRTAALAQVPYVDNQALYRLLGPSTYNPSSMDEDCEDEIRPVTTKVLPPAPTTVLPRVPVTPAIPQTPPTPKFFAEVGPEATCENQSLKAIIASFRSGKIDVPYAQSLVARLGELSIEDELIAIDVFGAAFFGAALPEEKKPSQPGIHLLPDLTRMVVGGTVVTEKPMRKELQTALDLYLDGADSYRKLGDALGRDKDHAGKLIRELQDLGKIKKSNDESN